MNLLYVTFGDNLQNHIQANFSIYSFLTQAGQVDTINVVTDRPEFYASLGDKLNVIQVSEKTLHEWKGKFEFFWRIKIKAIEHVCALYPGKPVLYLDADTFLYTPLAAAKEAMGRNVAYMHKKERSLADVTSKTQKNMWGYVNGQTFAGVTITRDHYMWNAGVVGVPNTQGGKECALALELCDEMLATNMRRDFIEQYSLAVALHELCDLQSAEAFIAHYWSSKKEWGQFMNEWFTGLLLKQITSPADITELFKTLNLGQWPVERKIKNTSVRLEKRLQQLFPPKELVYVQNQLS